MEAIWSTITALPTGQVALGTIVTIVILMVLTGKLVPRAVHEDRIADKNNEINNLVVERDAWREAHRLEADGSEELRVQNGKLVDGAETTKALLEALRSKVEDR